MGPDFEAAVPLSEVLVYGIFNPATIIVAFLLGQKADDKSKIMIAGFAGAAAGAALLYLAALLGIWDAPTLGRAAVGVFTVSLVAGFAYGALGYAMKGRIGG